MSITKHLATLSKNANLALLKKWNILPLGFVMLCMSACQPKSFQLQQKNSSFLLTTDHYTLKIIKSGFRYAFINSNGKKIASAHPVSGIQIGQKGRSLSDIKNTHLIKHDSTSLMFVVQTENGTKATIQIWLEPHTVRMKVKPKEEGKYTIMGRTKGVYPSYGLADLAHQNGRHFKSDLTGLKADPLRGGRMVSNFVIFPKQGLAEVNIETGDKHLSLTKKQNMQGSKNVQGMPSLYYFIGSTKEIYQAFLKIRNSQGYTVYKPKYGLFGVGWEAWGALAWHTNQETVTQNINQYLDHGYPLSWMVLGSGFWPHHKINYKNRTISAEKLKATTSFGLWDEKLYPDPKKMIRQFHQKGLKFMLGLRIAFIPGGLYTNEGLEHGYFQKNRKSNDRLFKTGYPKTKVYLLNTKNPEAVRWYVRLCEKWIQYGVDGFKEDLFGFSQWLPDDMLNPINKALMDDSVYVMGRNNYIGAPFDIARYNDFNYDQPQDRGPINGLAFAYAGFPNVYPDIVGGTGLATGRFDDQSRANLKKYLMRESMYAALNPSMSFGYGPWNLGKKTNAISLQAARLHHRLQPYFYSNAIKAYKTGFPYSLTPLPLAFPHDQNVYGLADTTRRSYEWMIGESLLATPVYGQDFTAAKSRDVYLPAGKWMDYDTGKVYEGPKTLENFALPVDKTPLFIGGKGIVIEQKKGQLVARIYPIKEQAKLTFYGKDGTSKSNIMIDHPDWKNMSITNLTENKSIQGQWTDHAYQFPITGGYNYILKK